MIAKADLRHRLLHDRLHLPEGIRLAAEAEITARVAAMRQWQHAQTIASYWSVRGEVSTQALMHRAWQEHKQYFLPVLPEQDTHLLFAPMTVKSQMQSNRYHIPEPVCEAALLQSPEQFQLILVPLVGFTEHGARLGMGKGFYDKTLAPLVKAPERPFLVGLAFECQKLTSLHVSHWDVFMDAVVTEERVYYRKASSSTAPSP